MQLISSSGPFFYKWVFPSIWFGFLGLFFIGFLIGAIKGSIGFGLLFFPLGMASFGFIIMKIFVWNLVDKVWDNGDSLIVENKGRTVRIDLLNIININHTCFTNPPSVTLTLRVPCEFGKNIKFSPPARILAFREHPVVTELVLRIDKKRQITE